MGDHPPTSTQAAAGPTPRPSSSNVIPNSSSNDTSPESQNTNPAVRAQPATDSGSSPSPTSPTGTGPRPGHGRIASTSTSNSKPEGYPSWLPRRPPPPEPASTIGVGTRPSTRAGFESPDSLADVNWELITGPGEEPPRRDSEDLLPEAGPSNPRRHTHSGLPTAGPSAPIAPKGERKPTPRSVRIVSVPGLGPALVAGSHAMASGSREPTESTRVPSGSTPGYRAYSRATGIPAMSPTLYNSLPVRGGRHSVGPRRPPSAPPQLQSQPPIRPPRFRTPKFHPTLLQDPSPWTRARWYAWGLFMVLGYVVFQTFLDFNLAYMMIQ